MAEVIHRFVNDLGVAAYLLMHGYAVIGKTEKSIYFECENEASSKEFTQLLLEYQPPNDFYIFDSCLMYLKKINELIPPEYDKVVSDLGVAAYLMMLECDKERSMGFKMVGKKGKNVYFSHPEGCGQDFDRRSYQYLPSQFQSYDSNLMALKKIGEYMPTK